LSNEVVAPMLQTPNDCTKFLIIGGVFPLGVTQRLHEEGQ